MKTKPSAGRTYAVITGAASGLGRIYARELARRGYGIIAIDKSADGLTELRKQLDTDIPFHFIEADLTDEDEIERISQQINEGFPVEVLINNVGTGGTRRFEQADPDYIANIIRLNVMPVSLLTRALLPNLMQRPQAYVLNVGSLSAFTPNGYKTVYPASKSFVHFLSRGLYFELRHTPVHVAVVHPGPMPTNPEIRSRIAKQGRLARWALSDPEKTVRVSLDKMFRRKSLIFIDWPNRINWMLTRLAPESVLARFMTRVVGRELERE